MTSSADQKSEPYLSTRDVLGIPPHAKVSPMLLYAVEKIVGIDQLNRAFAEFGPPWPNANKMVDLMFDKMNIKWRIENPEVLENLDDGPKVFVANHPYGLPDAFALFQLLTRYRPDIRIFANKLLEATELNDERMLYVDPFRTVEGRAQNRLSVAAAMTHMRNGGDLALFPGRICSHLKTTDWTISDSNWTDQIKKYVEAGGGHMVPLYISGRNSWSFNLSGLIHPRIRTYMLLREFLRGGHDFTFTVGTPVSADQLRKVSRSMSVGNFSRSLVYALKTGSPKIHDLPQLIEPELRNEREMAEVSRKAVAISGRPVKKLLDQEEVLVEHNGYTIFNIGPGISDDLIKVICEVRFQAYQAETTVTDPMELKDNYDAFYSHLVLWDNAKQMVAGVYRYTVPNPTNQQVTADNLVTKSIFDLKPEFEKLLPNAMELGRAAVLPEYQKSFSSLMLLWRGFLEIPKRDKNIKYLFGPVTMGRRFNPVSRELVRRYIMRNFGETSMLGLVSAKRELKFDIPREVEIEKLEDGCGSFAQLGNIVHGVEGGERCLPVLFRHYANCGCKFIGFGEWRELDGATTGLTLLDLRNGSKSFMQRFFGKEGAEAFMAGR